MKGNRTQNVAQAPSPVQTRSPVQEPPAAPSKARAASDDSPIPRRQFLSRTVKTAAVFALVPRHVLGGPGFTPPSEVITRAVLGTGGRGMAGHVTVNKEGEPPVTLAVCDVDQNHLAAAMKKVERACQAYTDFRRVLERKDIDTVHIATPPHWHAIMCIEAADAGKDVLCEKPMTKFIGEGQKVIEAIKRNGRVFQIGTYNRFGKCYDFGASSKLRKLVQSGLLGSPLTVRVDPRRGFNWKVKQWIGRTDLTPQPVPSELDYEMWLGPAPRKPYHPDRVHGKFRGYWDYDGGGLSDMAQHYLDPIQYVLGKDGAMPVEVEAQAPWPPHPDAVQMWGQARLTYADGTTLILTTDEWGEPAPDGLPFLEGPKGKVYANYQTDPPGLFEQVESLPDPPPLVQFPTAVRTRQQPGGNAESSHRSIALAHLANIAIRTGRKLRWDPRKEEFIGDEEANRFVHLPMRAPWHL